LQVIEVLPTEVKLSATPRPAMAGTINSFHINFGKTALSGYIHPVNVQFPASTNLMALPFNKL